MTGSQFTPLCDTANGSVNLILNSRDQAEKS
jgi:hypothetical protein